MNQYHIYEKIGRGQHSTVYKGRKKKTILYYAIKSVDKSQKARVLQEVRTMHALKHKNILQFYAWYETSNHLWLILEYCVGGDLLSILRQDMRLPESSIHDFARDLVTALQYLHSNSIIYCDLKPSNILLDENGRLKMGGFGLSRRLVDINKTPLTNLPPAKRGTPCYMAPELFSEGATHSTASDLWSLGCVLYECATGRPPFMNSSFNQLVHEILNNEPPPVTGASPEFADFLGQLLDKNPATRLSWKGMAEHPFFRCQIPVSEMPHEPALEAFIQRNNLAPVVNNNADHSAGDRARALRQSVDVMRLSRIALNNLEKDTEGTDYSTAQAAASDIRIESADAELDFEEAREDGGHGTVEGTSDEEEASNAGASVDDTGATAAPANDLAGQMSGLNMVGPNVAHATRRSMAAWGSTSSNGRPGTADDAASNASRPTTAAESEFSMDDATPHFGDTEDSLIWHPSDSSVKPIVNNRRIERLSEPRWDARSLPFTPMSAEELEAMVRPDQPRENQHQLEAFLTQVYKAMREPSPLKDKVNVLSYFESLCMETNSANVLVNSSLTILFIKLLKNAKAPTLRIRLASVLGLLVRHATFIADELASTGVLEVLGEALKDKNERVRRRAMATLGELLFYVATQQQDAPPSTSAPCWSISSATISMVMRMLKPGEDEITQHYAVKTIENICSQGGVWAAKFTSTEVAANVVQIFNADKGESLKVTAASTLARMMRHSPAISAFLLDKYGLRLFMTGLADAAGKVQASAANMVNLVLSQPEMSTRVRAALQDERGLVPAVLQLMDHSSPLLRAKAVVSVLLLCRISVRWLMEACKLKFIPIIERLQRDKDDYIQATITALRAEMAKLVTSICQAVNTCVTNQSSGQQQRDALSRFQVLLHLATSPCFRPGVFTPQAIKDLAMWLTAASAPAAATQAPGSLLTQAEFRTVLMHVLEALCQQSEIVLQHRGVLEQLLPALCAVVATTNETGDNRFFCLQRVSDVLQLYVAEPDLDAGGRESWRTTGIDRLLQEHILPLVPVLLSEKDPMPLYALKLLGGLLEANPRYVAEVVRHGLAPKFFKFLSLEDANNNVHNIRLCRQLVASGGLPAEQLQRMEVPEKVTAVLMYAHQNNVEPFLEPVLELCHAIVERDAADLAAGVGDAALAAHILPQLPLFLDLCTHPDSSIALAAAACVLVLGGVFPVDSATWLVSSEGVAMMTTALQGQHPEAAPTPAQVQVQQQLLSMLSTTLATDVRNAANLATPLEFAAMAQLLRHLMHSTDSTLRSLAVQANNLFTPYCS